MNWRGVARLLCRACAWVCVWACACAAQPGVPHATTLMSIQTATEAPSGVDAPRVTVRGTVTRVGDRIILQDQTGALEAVPQDAPVVEVGDEVEATGRPSIQSGVRLLVDATVNPLWHSSPPPPVALSADDAANGEHNELLVQVEGKLLRVTDDSVVVRLQLEAGHQFFSAELPRTALLNAAEGGRLGRLPVNSTVRLTGVLLVRQQQYSPAAGSFSLLLRDGADINVVKGPPWGTPLHIAELVLALVGIGGLMQFAHMRSVRRQFAAILAERARISRDVHDTLAQGFAGIALQLEVVRGDMQRNPSQAEAHLHTAVGMVRHCRAEAHRSISTLRAFSKSAALDQMLGDLISSITSASSADVHLELDTLSCPPKQRTAEQLFRICQEAVTNAVQHGKPRNIWVQLRQSRDAVCLTVRDDGCGFDVDRAAEHGTVHFGIIGMQERAAHLRAQFSLVSQPAGTVVQVSVPHGNAAMVKRRWLTGRRDHGTEPAGERV